MARVFAFNFAVQYLKEAYHYTQEAVEDMQQNLGEEGDSETNEGLEKADFALAELHMLSCGLKAFITQEVADSIDTLRRACGGHGFMSCSNLPRLFGLATAACTYEGENTVLQLQVGNLLLIDCRFNVQTNQCGFSFVTFFIFAGCKVPCQKFPAK